MPLAEAEFQVKLFPIPDRIRVTSDALPGMRLFYAEQDADFVPITAANLGEAYGPYAAAVEDQSNADLLSAHGIAFAGALLPDDAAEHPHVAGGFVSASDPVMNLPACHFLREPLLEADAYDGFDFYACWDADAPTSGVTVPTPHDCAETPVPIPGCTDPSACNYAPLATTDDGTCEYGSCACPADLDADGLIAVSDVLIVLGDFGCASACSADIDGDGLVGVSDILVVLAEFGLICS